MIKPVDPEPLPLDAVSIAATLDWGWLECGEEMVRSGFEILIQHCCTCEQIVWHYECFFPVSQGTRTWERVLPHELLVFVSTQDPMAPCSFRFRVFLQSYSYDIWTCAKAGLRHCPSIEFIRLDVALIIDDYCLFYLPQAGWGHVFQCIWGITCWSMLTFLFSVCLRL